MMNHSISEDSLQRFVDGASSHHENQAIVAHLLRGCAPCVATLRSAFSPQIPADAYDALFTRLKVPEPGTSVLRFERRGKPAPRCEVGARRARKGA